MTCYNVNQLCYKLNISTLSAACDIKSVTVYEVKHPVHTTRWDIFPYNMINLYQLQFIILFNGSKKNEVLKARYMLNI